VHRLTAGFVLAYHGCDLAVGERILEGDVFKPSNNDYDWLGPGIYFWEANPLRGLEFAREASRRKRTTIKTPFVIGAVIELGLCLDLLTKAGIELVKTAYESLSSVANTAGLALPKNTKDSLRRNLDCAVIRRVHSILKEAGLPPVDTVRGVFVEGKPIYPTAGFDEKTHIQIAVNNPACIKGVFRVPKDQLEPLPAR
jgi:hypothetical protein